MMKHLQPLLSNSTCAGTAGSELFVNYGPAKIDSQFVLDFGFADEFCSRPGYVLGPLSIPEAEAYTRPLFSST